MLLVAAGGPAVGGIAGLTLAITWADTLRDGGPNTALILIAAGLIGCGLWVLPTHLLSLVCGWAFGFWVGSFTALITATIAAPLGYAVAAKIIGHDALAWVNRYPKGAAVCQAIHQASAPRAGFLIALLRMSPAVPYGATNVLAAIFKLPIIAFMTGTFLGLAPRVMIVAGLGAGLDQLKAINASSTAMSIMGLGATLLLILGLSWITRLALDQVADQQTSGLIIVEK